MISSKSTLLPKLARTAVGVRVEGVSKSYEGQPVLESVSCEVKPGETFVVMGPSGAGKSVLLRALMGLEQPDKGKILIDGRDASDPRTHRELVTGIVFQSGALFNSMTVFENLALYPREHQLYSKTEIEDRVMRILGHLSLEKAASKFPGELSGGMRKRVAIARTLIMEPQLILYDEPTSELDPVMAATIAELIATLKEEFRVTSIVVSHDRDLASGIAD
ncbi:MAG TPA: ATP-binding cassette domain-containing protein, partial [Opitutales bacterium]|nr:ATP-binding cassette domain-containing protein [Opitutales bacterium]